MSPRAPADEAKYQPMRPKRSSLASFRGPGSTSLLTASLPLTVLAIAALFLGIQLQKRMSAATYFKILRVTLATFVVLLVGQAAIELARRFHIG